MHPLTRFATGLLTLACLPSLALGAGPRAPDRSPPAAAGGSAGPALVTHTFLAAQPGRREALARFVVANWFAMDRIAVAQGLFKRYRLLENPATDGDWDLIVEVEYHDACGYPCVAERFEAIRGAHTPVPVDGRLMKDLGRVVNSISFRERVGG